MRIGVRFCLSWIVGTLFLIALDSVWLGFIAKGFYHAHLVGILRSPPLIAPALIVWLLVVLGNLIVVTVLMKPASYISSAMAGGFYGLIIFGVYNFTNVALLTHWPLVLAFVDIGWGIVVNVALAVFLWSISHSNLRIL